MNVDSCKCTLFKAKKVVYRFISFLIVDIVVMLKVAECSVMLGQFTLTEKFISAPKL